MWAAQQQPMQLRPQSQVRAQPVMVIGARDKGKGRGKLMQPSSSAVPGQPPSKRPRLAQPGQTTGEVRFLDALSAQYALQMSGTKLAGCDITVELDARSKDQTKVIVSGLSPGMDWNVLKQHFQGCGEVKYADVKGTTPSVGTVRFETPQEAQAALALDGAVMEGHELSIKPHAGSKDGTKLQILNVPPTFEWQELKDFFAQHGHTPIFAGTSSSSGGSVSAEVRFDDPQHAQGALQLLNGSILGGAEIKVILDATSSDGSKLRVTGIPPGLEWQEVKDHFAQCGTVAFVNVDGEKGAKGGNIGKGSGKGCLGKGVGPMDMMQMMMNMMQMQQNMMANMGLMKKGGVGGMATLGNGAACGKAGAGKAVGKGGRGAAEVRYDVPMHAQMAVATLNGSVLKGAKIACGFDATSQDGSKLWVSGLAPGTSWQELKDHFAICGQVAFAALK